jgi:hypothetical protein
VAAFPDLDLAAPRWFASAGGEQFTFVAKSERGDAIGERRGAVARAESALRFPYGIDVARATAAIRAAESLRPPARRSIAPMAAECAATISQAAPFSADHVWII